MMVQLLLFRQPIFLTNNRFDWLLEKKLGYGFTMPCAVKFINPLINPLAIL